MRRRYASHYLFIPEKGFLKQHIIEIGEDGYFVRSFPLTEEIENVSWLPGIILLEETSPDHFKAFHLSPFDFEKMTPVAETLRTPLL